MTTMTKEDILLDVELKKLRIETYDAGKKDINDNPFSPNTQTKNCIHRYSNTIKCYGMLDKHKKIGKCKNKTRRILKEPVLNILKSSCTYSLSVSSKETVDHFSKTQDHKNVDILNLCTLVQNCNQLKISGTKADGESIVKANETLWWKNHASAVEVRSTEENRQSSRSGTCSQQALNPPCDITIDELASYFETMVHIPKKMSSMAEMMYI